MFIVRNESISHYSLNKISFYVGKVNNKNCNSYEFLDDFLKFIIWKNQTNESNNIKWVKTVLKTILNLFPRRHIKKRRSHEKVSRTLGL